MEVFRSFRSTYVRPVRNPDTHIAAAFKPYLGNGGIQKCACVRPDGGGGGGVVSMRKAIQGWY